MAQWTLVNIGSVIACCLIAPRFHLNQGGLENRSKTHIAVSCLGWDYKNPLHLDVVDRYLRRMGDKTIPDEAPPSLESFYPPWVAGIDLPQSRCCGFFVSFTNEAQEHRHFVGCLAVVIHIRKWRLIACVVMVTSWRLFVMQNNACHPLTQTTWVYTKISNTVVHLLINDIFVSGILCCVCLYAHKYRLIQRIIRSLNWVG